MTLKHQYSTTGQHRIVELDISGFLKEAGEWTTYQNIATYITKFGAVYMCVTGYFEGGPIKPDTIYLLSKTDFKSERHIPNGK